MTVGEFAREEWHVWSCVASVVVPPPADEHAAANIVREIIADVDQACNRFREDSELARLTYSLDGGAEVSAVLAALVNGALQAAEWTDGDVDPTLGNELNTLGYDRDVTTLNRVETAGVAVHNPRSVRRPRRWPAVRLVSSTLTVPRGIRLDLGATAKAIAADWAAARIQRELGCAALVSLGGDIATAGKLTSPGWEVLVQDRDEDPFQQVALTPGAALATSSTQKRRWNSGGFERHHILDPRFGLPAESPWRSVTVASHTCLHANALATASIVRGFRAVKWLDDLGVSARFVDLEGAVITTADWPASPEVLAAGALR